MTVSPNVGNVHDLKQGIELVFVLTLDVLHHHVSPHLPDLDHGLLHLVPLDAGEVSVQVAGEGPGPICVDSNKNILIVFDCRVVGCQQRSEI